VHDTYIHSNPLHSAEVVDVVGLITTKSM
jgi:hypothetical protein